MDCSDGSDETQCAGKIKRWSFLQEYRLIKRPFLYHTIKFVFFIACLNVNHIHDNPGHYTCDCVDSSDPCFADAGCVVEERCPESDGKSTGTNLPNISNFLKKKREYLVHFLILRFILQFHQILQLLQLHRIQQPLRLHK